MNDYLTGSRNNKIRILLLSTYKIIQESLKILIEDNQNLTVIGCGVLENSAAPEGLKDVDVVVIYLIDQDAEKVEIISALLDSAPNLRVVVVTSSSDYDSQTRAVELGAMGIVHKEQNSRTLVEAIRQTYKGDTWINQQLLTKLLRNKNPKTERSKSWNLLQADSLTPREKEVIQMIGKGLKNKEIADRLFISEATVRHHLSSIYGKLDVEDRLNLVIYAYQHNLIQVESPGNVL